MRVAYMNPDNTVREIIPDEARPVAQWYNEEFASHCMEIPDDVHENWEYDPENNRWYEPGTRPVIERRIIKEMRDMINSV